MKVLKFGGTSVGSAERIKNVARLVSGRGRNVVVLSAMSGTTNTLVEISEYLYKQNLPGAHEVINQLEDKYRATIADLYSTPEAIEAATTAVGERFATIRSLAKDLFTMFDEKEMLAQGELMSTAMMHIYMQEQGINSVLLPALEFMRVDKNDEPDSEFLRTTLGLMLDEHEDADLFITQGFICRNAYGEVHNLQRGGSDYTASLIGAAINADEIEIWTDIDGMHNNDPRFVEGTRPVRLLHFDEAAELAYFGAKILHPTCVQPAKLAGIPVRLLNTLQPEQPGTLINNRQEGEAIKAIAAKDGITAIKVKSSRMFQSYNFLSRVFEVFETYKTPTDLVATSEVGVSVTIDNERRLPEILDELRKLGTVTVDHDMVIICVVGALEWHNRGYEAVVVEALADIPIRMISYGGSNYNISLLVQKEDKIRTLNLLSNHLFKNTQ